MSEQKTSQGRFVWADLMATDPTKAAAFYSELMNWSTAPWGEHYTMFKLGEKGIAGTAQLPPQAAGVPSHWLQYVTVDDVDAAANKVQELGGSILMGPMDLPDVGRSVTIRDPQGAVIILFRSSHGEKPESEQPGMGEFCWHELLTDDIEKSKAFYQTLFGWEFEKAEMPMEYWIGKRGDQQTCAIMARPEMVPVNTWSSYLLVEDIHEAKARAEKLGATAQMEPEEVPQYGIFAPIVDPVGAMVLLFQSTMES